MNELETIDIRTGRPFTGLQKARPHGSIDCECINGSWGRARGLMGGAFMGTLLAQQGESKQYTASDYITDGAFFIFDVRENAGPGVHSASKVAYDFATKSSTNFNTFQDNYVTDMTADYLAPSDITAQYIAFRFRQDVAVPYTFEAKTVEIVELMSADSIAVQTDTWNSNMQGITNAPVVSQLRDDTTTLRLGLAGSNPQNYAYVYVSAVPTIFSAVHTYTSVVSSGLSKLYVDGTKMSEASNAPTIASYSTLPGIAMYYGKGIARLYTVRLYERALTDAEVAANYAVDKARFNLT